MNSQVLHTVWCNISGEAAGEIRHWSLLGVKGVSGGLKSPRFDRQPVGDRGGDGGGGGEGSEGERRRQWGRVEGWLGVGAVAEGSPDGVLVEDESFVERFLSHLSVELVTPGEVENPTVVLVAWDQSERKSPKSVK